MARGEGLTTRTPVLLGRVRARQEALIAAGPRGAIEALIDSTAWALADDTQVTLEFLASYDGGATYVSVCSATWTSAKVRASLITAPPAGRSPNLGPQLAWEPGQQNPKPNAFKVAILSTRNIDLGVKVRTD